MCKKITIVCVLVLCLVGIHHSNKALPAMVNYEGPEYMVDADTITFFTDETFVNGEGERFSEQEIFDEVFRMIDEAQSYVLIDLFFYSDFIGVETSSYRQLSNELTQKLIEKKTTNPDITIQVITDPINVMYGGHVSSDFELLREAGITVVITELKPLRDSNPFYSSLWRTAFQWFGVSDKEGWLPNPLDEKSPDLGLRTYFKMLNYKANHRKVVLTDYENDGGRGLATLITSANPHDGSSAHSNIAVRMDTHLWQDVLNTERAVAEFSGHVFIAPGDELQESAVAVDAGEGSIKAQMLTEGAIEERVVAEIDALQAGDDLRIAMFYIADRDVVKALRRADERGVSMQLLFDPNKDAFGREKNGTPNRQVAHELMSHTNGSTQLRWCDTHGEQCHSKLLLAKRGEEVTLLQGSANFTKRNLGNYNLETNMVLTGDASEQIFVDAYAFFDRQWGNEADAFYSTAYETYSDDSTYRTFVYRFKELTGLSRW